MAELQMGPIESRFADIIWDNEPISSSELAKKSEAELTWKKTTSYTVLKRLCDKGIFVNNRGMQSAQYVEETFDGSLPAFIAAFTKQKKLSSKEIAEIQKMIEEAEEK